MKKGEITNQSQHHYKQDSQTLSNSDGQKVRNNTYGVFLLKKTKLNLNLIKFSTTSLQETENRLQQWVSNLRMKITWRELIKAVCWEPVN